MAQSYVITSLPDYVDQSRDQLIAQSVIGAKTANLFTLMTGVKGTTALNLIQSNIVFGDGSACGWDEAGTATLSQRNLEPAALKVNMGICDKTLLAKWASYKVKVAANKADGDLPFEADLMNEITKGIDAGIESMIWTGDADNTNQFDGIITILDDAKDASDVSVTGGTAYAYLKALAAQIPTAIAGKDDLVIFCSVTTYREFMQDLVTANLYHYDPAQGDNEYYLPGTNIKVIGVPGLDGVTNDRAVAGSLSNFFYGVDLESDKETFDVWYSKDNREFRVAVEFIAGVQVAYPDEVVLGQRSAESQASSDDTETETPAGDDTETETPAGTEGGEGGTDAEGGEG